MNVNFSIAFFRALGHLPGGLARFIPCQPGAHYARLSHLGWGRYGHGLSSRPRESCDHQFLTPLLNFFGHPDGAVAEFFNGTSKLVGIYPPWLFTGGCSWSWTQYAFSGSWSCVRAAKRLRITGKSSARRREPFSGDGLPTPKRWGRLVPQGAGSMGIEDGVCNFLFPRTGVGWRACQTPGICRCRFMSLISFQPATALLPFN